MVIEKEYNSQMWVSRVTEYPFENFYTVYKRYDIFFYCSPCWQIPQFTVGWERYVRKT